MLQWRDKEIRGKIFCQSSRLPTAFKLSSIGKKKSRMNMQRRTAKYVCCAVQEMESSC